MRQGKPEDFDALMSILDDDAASEFAAERFGTKSPMVLYHRERVQELANTARTAIDDFQKGAAERTKQQSEVRTNTQRALAQEIQGHWNKHISDVNGKYAAWFKPIENDVEGNKLLSEGFDLAKSAFSNLNLYDSKLTPEQRERLVAGQAAIINKGAAFDRLAHSYKQRGVRIQQLETELKQYQDSEPGAGEGRGKKMTAPMTGEQSFRERIKSKLR